VRIFGFILIKTALDIKPSAYIIDKLKNMQIGVLRSLMKKKISVKDHKIILHKNLLEAMLSLTRFSY
jgi:hypothetical protein